MVWAIGRVDHAETSVSPLAHARGHSARRAMFSLPKPDHMLGRHVVAAHCALRKNAWAGLVGNRLGNSALKFARLAALHAFANQQA